MCEKFESPITEISKINSSDAVRKNSPEQVNCDQLTTSEQLETSIYTKPLNYNHEKSLSTIYEPLNMSIGECKIKTKLQNSTLCKAFEKNPDQSLLMGGTAARIENSNVKVQENFNTGESVSHVVKLNIDQITTEKKKNTFQNYILNQDIDKKFDIDKNVSRIDNSANHVKQFFCALNFLTELDFGSSKNVLISTIKENALRCDVTNLNPLTILDEKTESILSDVILQMQEKPQVTSNLLEPTKVKYQMCTALLDPILKNFSYGVNLEELDGETTEKSVTEIIEIIKNKIRKFVPSVMLSNSASHICMRLMLQRDSERKLDSQNSPFTSSVDTTVIVPAAPPPPTISCHSSYHQDYPLPTSSKEPTTTSANVDFSNMTANKSHLQAIANKVKFLFEKKILNMD